MTGNVCLLQVPEEMQSLLGSLGQGVGVDCPGEVLPGCEMPRNYVLITLSTVEPFMHREE